VNQLGLFHPDAAAVPATPSIAPVRQAFPAVQETLVALAGEAAARDHARLDDVAVHLRRAAAMLNGASPGLVRPYLEELAASARSLVEQDRLANARERCPSSWAETHLLRLALLERALAVVPVSPAQPREPSLLEHLSERDAVVGQAVARFYRKLPSQHWPDLWHGLYVAVERRQPDARGRPRWFVEAAHGFPDESRSQWVAYKLLSDRDAALEVGCLWAAVGEAAARTGGEVRSTQVAASGPRPDSHLDVWGPT